MAGLLLMSGKPPADSGALFPHAASTEPMPVVDAACRFPEASAWQQEQLQYRVYYQAGPVWIGAGDLVLRMVRDWRKTGAPWHAVAEARSSKRIDRFFPVRDRYETWMDPSTGMPTAFLRNVQEGSYAFQWSYAFDRKAGSLDYQQTRPSGTREGRIDSVPACAGDLFSTLHAIRFLDWESRTPGTALPIQLVVDGQLQQLSVLLEARTQIHVDGNAFDCLVLRPKLLVGDYFKGKDGLRLWVTDDARRLPVHAEAEILIGALKADLVLEP